ncbi:MAG: tetratricopeptide repeat protein [Candidatus Krumholzibacteriota bacterium]
MLRIEFKSIVSVWLGAMVAAVLLSPAPVRAETEEVEAEAEAEAKPVATLTSLGLELETIRFAASMGDQAAAEALARTYSGLDGDLIPEGAEAAAALLWGRINQERGTYGKASSAYAEAADKASDRGLRAAAEFLEIASREAEGKDEEAAKSWFKWMGEYPDHALAPDARLHLAWNRLRRGEVSAAAGDLINLRENNPWLGEDPRHFIGLATSHYLLGEYDQALAIVRDRSQDPEAIYLRALIHQTQGNNLKAAAAFQEVSDRFGHSPLHDIALLAKANTFLASQAYRSAAEEFGRVTERASDPAVVAEAGLRRAASVFMYGDLPTAEVLLREVVAANTASDVGARAQFLLGEVMVAADDYDAAILEYNRVLTSYFDQGVAASAQYRLGRCFDALDRPFDATSAYQAVVSGYPLEPEAPAAAYLAGAGLLSMGKPRLAVPYFQLVLDRYASNEDSDGTIVFASAEHQELAEASLCLLEWSYHQTNDLGQLTGAPHLMLQKTPPSQSTWRAYALLIDADALAAQGQHQKARESLENLFREFPEHPSSPSAKQLLAWTYAQQGEEDLAIQTSEDMLASGMTTGDPEQLAGAFLNVAHVRFNQGRYDEAASAYEEFLTRYPSHEHRNLALYQAGLSYLRLDRAGDAVDRWETIVRTEPDIEIAEKAWARAGDLYFQADEYVEAQRCYQGLLENFAGSSASALGLLRIAQCDYNAGRDAEALAGYSELVGTYPDSPMAREAERGIEMALYRLGQNAEGVDQLAQLVELYPTSSFAADAQFQIAKKLYEQERYLDAADEFRRVVSQFPGYSAADRAQFLMGDAYAMAENDDQAQQAFEQFLVFFGESGLRTTVRFRLGMNYFQQAEYFRAATNFTDVLEKDPEGDMAKASLYNLALCRRLMGSHAEAAVEFARYRERYAGDERAAEVAFQLGDIHDLAGRTDEAVTELEKALAAGPGSDLKTEIHYRLGACKEKLADRTGALAAYAKAAASKRKSDPFRLSAIARSAGLYEEAEQYPQALEAYRDLMDNSEDPELVAAATGRASELEAVIK